MVVSIQELLLDTWSKKKIKRAGTPLLSISIPHKNESDPFNSWHKSKERLRIWAETTLVSYREPL